MLDEIVPIRVKDLHIDSFHPSQDCLIPRGPLLDTFIRPVSRSGNIIYEHEELDLDPKVVLPYLNGDLYVQQEMATMPNLTPLLQGSVSIRVYFLDSQGNLTSCMGNGALLPNKLVLTAGHLLELEDGGRLIKIEVYNRVGVCVQAIPKPIPDTVLSDVRTGSQSMTDGTRVGKIDAVILELIDPVPADFGKPFKLPLGSGRQISPTEPIVMSGVPSDALAMVSSPVRNLIPDFVRCNLMENFNLSHQDLDLVAENLYRRLIGATQNRIVAFGAVLSESSASTPTFRMYTSATYSTAEGLGGSPIVAVSSPDMLLGINCGGLQDRPISYYMNTYSRFSQKLWEWHGLQ